MRTLSLLFILPFLFTMSSCDKCEKKEKDAHYYYSTDFKNSDSRSGGETILDINITEIDILYTVFFYEDKIWKYKLVAESSDIQNSSAKSNVVLAYEEGESNTDDDLNILFVPDSNPSGSYSGYFENNKSNFKASLPGINDREINFLEK